MKNDVMKTVVDGLLPPSITLETIEWLFQD
jgi:hypothetical protein